MSWFKAKPAPQPPTSNGDLGKLGENLATEFLLAAGYRIIERNFRCKGGEIDIIAHDPVQNSLVFAEVKSRRGLSYGVPQLAVTPFKQRQISKAALTYISQHKLHNQNARFDVITILFNAGGSHTVEQIRNAFELAY